MHEYDDLKNIIEQQTQQIKQLKQRVEQRVDHMLENAVFVSTKMAEQCETINRAYTQRAIAAVALAHTVLAQGGSAGIGLDSNEDKDSNWRTVLYVDTPAGQLSWHIAPADKHMLEGLPQYTKAWDGTYCSGDNMFYKEFLK